MSDISKFPLRVQLRSHAADAAKLGDGDAETWAKAMRAAADRIERLEDDLLEMDRPSNDEIDRVINAIVENEGPRWPGMTYENGVRAALDWVLGNEPKDPFDQD